MLRRNTIKPGTASTPLDAPGEGRSRGVRFGLSLCLLVRFLRGVWSRVELVQYGHWARRSRIISAQRILLCRGSQLRQTGKPHRARF
jgi:hypothetical protein